MIEILVEWVVVGVGCANPYDDKNKDDDKDNDNDNDDDRFEILLFLSQILFTFAAL